MPTLFRVGAYRVVVYLNDHSPAHVHAVGPDGEARFALGIAPDEVTLIETDGIGRRALREIVAAIIDRHEECLKAWRRIHGE